MQVTYELTQRDFYDGVIACRNRGYRKWLMRVIVTLVLGFALLAVVVLIVRPGSEALSNLAPLFLLVGFWALLIWGWPLWTARNQFSKQPSAHGPHTLRVDDAGVHWQWDGGTADIQWKNLIRWQETKTLILLYSSPVCFNLVPKRALTAEDVTQFRAFLADHIPTGRRSIAAQQ